MKQNGFTFAEIVVVVLIMGVLAAVTVPRLQWTAIRYKQAHAAARKLVADLRRARAMAMTDAATNNKGFEIVMVGHPSTTGYQLEDLDSHDTLETVTFDTHVTVAAGDSKYDFGPLGNLTKGGNDIVITSEGRSYTISFVSTTGAVVLTEG